MKTCKSYYVIKQIFSSARLQKIDIKLHLNIDSSQTQKFLRCLRQFHYQMSCTRPSPLSKHIGVAEFPANTSCGEDKSIKCFATFQSIPELPRAQLQA